MASSNINQLKVLSQEVADNTGILTEYLESRGIDAPSFDPDGLDSYSIPPDEPAFKARLALISATKKLNDLALGPKESLMLTAWDPFNTLSFHVIYEFRVAEAVPPSGDISFADLAEKVSSMTGTPISMHNLRRLVRHAMTNNLFCEPRKGYVAHTRSSKILLEDEKLKEFLGYFPNHLWLPIAHGVAALKKWPCSTDAKHTPLSASRGREILYWEALAEDENMQRRLTMAMEVHGRSEGFDVKYTVSGYDWGKLGKGTIVDMGGNQGQAAIAVAEAFPDLKFIVQDLPGTRLPSTIGKVPEHLADRVSLTTHDFTTPQTVVADAYMFRWVFHMFGDEQCVSIIKNLEPVMRKGSRVIVNEGVIADSGELHYLEEKTTRSMDLVVFTMGNSRQRDIDDWKELFEKADERWEFTGARKPEGGRVWFLEWTWKG